MLGGGLLVLGIQGILWFRHYLLDPLQRVLEAPGWAPYLGGETGFRLALACWRSPPCLQQYQQQIPSWQPQELLLAWPLVVVALGLLWPPPSLARKAPGSARWSRTRDVQHLLHRQLPPRKN